MNRQLRGDKAREVVNKWEQKLSKPPSIIHSPKYLLPSIPSIEYSAEIEVILDQMDERNSLFHVKVEFLVHNTISHNCAINPHYNFTTISNI